MNPAGGQQPTPTPQPTMPGTAPGASPLDQPAATTQTADESSKMLDQAFVRNALEGGMAEVEMGQLATEKSNNADVKQFGQKMVDDHTKLGDQMKDVAQQLNVKAPASPSKKQKAEIAKLKALSGDDFDKAYIKEMIKDHKQDEKDFKNEARNASDPNLKQAATQGSQVIGEHLQMIEQIAQKDNLASK